MPIVMVAIGGLSALLFGSALVRYVVKRPD